MNLNQQPSNVETFICGHLFRNERAIGYVFHDFDGSLSMTCGWSDCDVNRADNCVLSGLGHMREREPKLRDLDWLPAGTVACNAPEDGWHFTPLDEGAG